MELDDLRLVHALQLAPRASFSHLSGVIGIHERTAARRYQRLCRAGILRIFGAVNPMALGHQFFQVRVRCRPDASESMANALAARDDITWVGVTAGGSEVSFSVRSLSTERRDVLLTRLLPRSAHVLGIDTAVVLHVFLGLSSRGWTERDGVLTPEQIARLTKDEAPQGEPTAVTVEPYDSAIFSTLAANGRATTAQLAQAAGISEARAARRLATLLRTRILVIDLDVAHEAFGYTTGAYIYFTVTPAHLPEVGRRLAQLPEIGFVAAMSGPHNLIASVACRDLAHLYECTTEHIGPLPGIVSMEIVPFARIVKQSGGLVVDGRLAAPPT